MQRRSQVASICNTALIGLQPSHQGCSNISGMLIRLLGSATRMRASRSLQASDTLMWLGKLYSTFKMRCSTGQGPVRQ